MGRLVKADFWGTRDTPALARRLLGKYLVMRTNRGLEARRIVEVEAYDGPRDEACHASKGRTARTEIMFGGSGHWYVYLVYGMYDMLNLVTGPPGYPAAVLIRGLEGVKGPGRLTRDLGIDRRFNGLPASRVSGLWIEDRGPPPPARTIRRGPRIGIGYAGEIWASKPWRYWIGE